MRHAKTPSAETLGVFKIDLFWVFKVVEGLVS